MQQLQEKEREDEARRKDEEEKAFKRKKEEEEVKKKKEKETLVTAGLDMGQDDEKRCVARAFRTSFLFLYIGSVRVHQLRRSLSN